MLRLSLSPSYYLAVVLAAAHALSLGVLAVIAWPVYLKIAAAVALVFSLVFNLRRYALLQDGRSVVALMLHEDGRIDAVRRDGLEVVGRQMPGGFVHPWFTSIVWRPDGARFSLAVPVLADSLPAEQFRALRVWLKWQRLTPEKSRT